MGNEYRDTHEDEEEEGSDQVFNVGEGSIGNHLSLCVAFECIQSRGSTEDAPICSGKLPRYDKPSLKIGELSRMCQLLAQGRDKSRQTTQSHWRVLQAYVLYTRTRRGDLSEE